MNTIDLSKSSRCPGCGAELPKNKLSFLNTWLIKDYDHPPLRYRDDIRVSHRGAYYCGACTGDLDRWSIRCDDCGKKMFGHCMMKVDGFYYCPECFKALEPYDPDTPVNFSRNVIMINYEALAAWQKENKSGAILDVHHVFPLIIKSPVISLRINGKPAYSFELETLPEENFTGKYFISSIRLRCTSHLTYTVQIDGFVSDDPETKEIGNNTGYRFEGFYLLNLKGRIVPLVNRAADLASKGLRYPGYITPGNVRLVGICPDCGKSFTFRSYNFPMMMLEPCYSDDGLDVLALGEYLKTEYEKNAWSGEANGKTFRYYNSFRCRHCGKPYLDYRARHAAKRYGNYGCAYLGHEVNYA